MRRSIAAGFVAMMLFATACGGSDEADPPSSDGSASASEAGADASRLIDELGSDEAATDALIIAMDRGYSGDQILEAVDGNRLRSDGTIEGQEPSGPPLDLVLYDVDDGDEEAFGGPASGVEVVMVSFVQVEQTPIERLRASATVQRGVGDPATTVILARLLSGFTPEDVITTLILGVDGAVDHPDKPDGPPCLRVVDELFCPFGQRFPAPSDSATPDGGTEPVGDDAVDSPESAPAVTEPDDAEPMQLLWEGELIPDPNIVDNPVAGSYTLTRTDGTDDFQLTLATTDAKTGTFTTDGFNEVECTAEWSSRFEGTGTFWDVNDLGIEFEGDITRQIVYVAGPCDSVLDPETSDFSGVVVFITDEGIELSFNGWSFAVAGPPPTPVAR